MASTCKGDYGKSAVSLVQKLGIKPLTKHNLLFYYGPINGALSYTALSVNVMNPSVVARVFPNRDVTNFLLLNSLIGSGLYLYNRPHMNQAPLQLRLSYCAYGALIFSFGSVLLWAVIRSLLPQNSAIATIFGVASSATLIRVGKSYVNYVDDQLPRDAN